MTRREIIQALQDVFQACFFDEDIVIEDGMTAADVDGWDSLSHVRLLLLAEKRFGVKLSVAETAYLNDVGGLITLVEAKLSGR